MLTLIPQGGLCNRMRAIDAASELCKKADVPFNIQWHKDPGLNCDYDDLFTPSTIIKSVRTIDYNGTLSQLIKSTRKRLYKFMYDQYIPDDELLVLQSKQDRLLNLVKEKNICIASCSRFYTGDSVYHLLQPSNQIVETAKKIISTDDEIIGVHVRRNDHQVAIQNSPIEMFKIRMTQLLKDRPNLIFFLATDCIMVEKDMHESFPNKIITYSKKEYSRSKKQAIIDALIDVVCLSRTKLILGSDTSSFSEEAALLGKVNLEIVKL